MTTYLPLRQHFIERKMQLVSNQVIASLDYFRAPSRLVPVQRLVSNGYRLDPPAFLSEQQGHSAGC